MSIIFNSEQNQDDATKRDIEKVRKILKEDTKGKTTIYYQASPDLIELLVQDTHPIVKQIPKQFKEVLIKGDGLLIQKRMMLDWIDAKLDDNNAFILNNGEVRLVQDKNVKL